MMLALRFCEIIKTKQEFLQAYYSTTNGIGYSLARTTIHSCDFSTASYTYIAEGWGVEDFQYRS
jgi:glucosylceramidase